MPENPNRFEPVYETHRTEWNGIALTIRHCRSWLSSKAETTTQHIEVCTVPRVPLPITETGYRSIFLNGADGLSEFDDDPVAYVTAHINFAAQSKAWRDKEDARRQFDLF